MGPGPVEALERLLRLWFAYLPEILSEVVGPPV
jgi:hypothetical protein